MASPARPRDVQNRCGRCDSHLFDDIAATLGFEASTREQLAEDEITMEQIESVFGRPRDGSAPEVVTDGGE